MDDNKATKNNAAIPELGEEKATGRPEEILELMTRGERAKVLAGAGV